MIMPTYLFYNVGAYLAVSNQNISLLKVIGRTIALLYLLLSSLNYYFLIKVIKLVLVLNNVYLIKQTTEKCKFYIVYIHNKGYQTHTDSLWKSKVYNNYYQNSLIIERSFHQLQTLSRIAPDKYEFEFKFCIYYMKSTSIQALNWFLALENSAINTISLPY